MEAAQILSTPKADAAALFPGDSAAIKASFRKLAVDWHPDANKAPEATSVFRHLIDLRDAALAGAGSPKRPSVAYREFDLPGGKTFRIKNLKSLAGDLGEILVGPRSVSWLIDEAMEDLADAAEMKPFGYADFKMRLEMEKLCPKLQATSRTRQGSLLIYERSEDQVLMADLVSAYGGKVPAEHVAWFISGMLNLACYLETRRTAHGDFSMQSLLISPLHHSVALTGPTFYATQFGDQPNALPERTIGAVPRIAIDGETAGPSIDLELIRLTAREALGDASGATLLRNKAIPEPMALWLVMPSEATAQKDYAAWERARDAGFGPPKFVEMQVSPKAVYGG